MHGRVERLYGCQGMRGAEVEEGVGVEEDKEVHVEVVVAAVGEDKEVQAVQAEDKPICQPQIMVNSCESQTFE